MPAYSSIIIVTVIEDRVHLRDKNVYNDDKRVRIEKKMEYTFFIRNQLPGLSSPKLRNSRAGLGAT